MDEKCYLLCITDGQVGELDMFMEWAGTVLDKARTTDHKQILIDNRTFELQLSPMDVVAFATHMEETGTVRQGFRLAVLSCPKNLDVSRLVETALINRSASYKSFRTQKEAMGWLVP